MRPPPGSRGGWVVGDVAVGGGEGGCLPLKEGEEKPLRGEREKRKRRKSRIRCNRCGQEGCYTVSCPDPLGCPALP